MQECRGKDDRKRPSIVYTGYVGRWKGSHIWRSVAAIKEEMEGLSLEKQREWRRSQGIFSFEFPSFLVTISCVKLT